MKLFASLLIAMTLSTATSALAMDADAVESPETAAWIKQTLSAALESEKKDSIVMPKSHPASYIAVKQGRTATHGKSRAI